LVTLKIHEGFSNGTMRGAAAYIFIETPLTGSAMAVNKPMGDNARKGAVKKRSQLATKTMDKKT
jgi:hypothetical protein